jgi:hypothetical protein
LAILDELGSMYQSFSNPYAIFSANDPDEWFVILGL